MFTDPQLLIPRFLNELRRLYHPVQPDAKSRARVANDKEKNPSRIVEADNSSLPNRDIEGCAISQGSMPTARSIQKIPSFPHEADIGVHGTQQLQDFIDFRNPNEKHPEKMYELLEKIPIEKDSGVFTTGTERAFFLAGAIGLKYPGFLGLVVIRDINPVIYYYNNAVIMLLRLASNHKQFIHLASSINESDKNTFDKRVKEIRKLLAKDKEIPEEMRKHYEVNLTNMLSVYVKVLPWRTDTSFDALNYHLPANENLFLNLQTLAKAGHILPTIGSIDDLESIARYINLDKIALVDTSNISSYVLLNFPIKVPILHTSGTGSQCTTFLMNISEPLSNEEREEFNELNTFMEIENKNDLQNLQVDFDCPYTDDFFCGYNRETFKQMKDFKKYFINFSCGRTAITYHKLNRIDLTTLRQGIEDNQKELSLFSQRFVEYWASWRNDPERYFAFSALPGWKEAFVDKLKKMEELGNTALNQFIKNSYSFIPNEICDFMTQQGVAPALEEENTKF